MRVSHGSHQVQKRDSVDDEPQLLVREEGVKGHIAESRDEERSGATVVVEGPGKREEGEEDAARECCGEVPPERLGLRGGRERENERERQSKVIQLFTVSGLGGRRSSPTLGIFLRPDLHPGS